MTEQRRDCHSCNAHGRRGVRATHVAGDRSGLQWYECGQHARTDNSLHVKRTTLQPLEQWLREHRMTAAEEAGYDAMIKSIRLGPRGDQ